MIHKIVFIYVVSFFLVETKYEFNGMRDAQKDEFPYIVSIQGRKLEEIFGGYLITANRLVTSCRCGENVLKSPLNELNVYDGWAIVAGTNSLTPKIEDDSYQFRQIKKITDFDHCGAFLGYLILESHSRFILNSHVSLAPLMNYTDGLIKSKMKYSLYRMSEKNETCFAAIWDGDIDFNAINDPSLKLIYIQLSPENICKQKLCTLYQKFCSLKIILTCGEFHFGNKPCVDFEGAPIICAGYVLGVNSWSTECEKEQFLALFTPFERLVKPPVINNGASQLSNKINIISIIKLFIFL